MLDRADTNRAVLKKFELSNKILISMNTGSLCGVFVSVLGLSLGKLLCYERGYRQEDCCPTDPHSTPLIPPVPPQPQPA